VAAKTYQANGGGMYFDSLFMFYDVLNCSFRSTYMLIISDLIQENCLKFRARRSDNQRRG
jgi:hypothetical protein